jgi:hypothetical protein
MMILTPWRSSSGGLRRQGSGRAASGRGVEAAAAAEKLSWLRLSGEAFLLKTDLHRFPESKLLSKTLAHKSNHKTQIKASERELETHETNPRSSFASLRSPLELQMAELSNADAGVLGLKVKL